MRLSQSFAAFTALLLPVSAIPNPHHHNRDAATGGTAAPPAVAAAAIAAATPPAAGAPAGTGSNNLPTSMLGGLYGTGGGSATSESGAYPLAGSAGVPVAAAPGGVASTANPYPGPQKAVPTEIVNPQFDTAAMAKAEADSKAELTKFAAESKFQKVAQLMVAATAREKLDILSTSEDWLYDFNKEEADTIGPDGRITKADTAAFPASQLTNVAIAIGSVYPCGIVTPHSHPRASEHNIIAEGSLVSQMTLENKVRTINHTLTKYQMTIYPQGSMHMEFNPGCTNATFISAFTNSDPGVQQTIQTFLNFGSEVLTATLGGKVMVSGKDIDLYKDSVPKNIAYGVESCLKLCGIQKRSLDESKAILKRELQERNLDEDHPLHSAVDGY